jgi:hypothetical protein
VLASLVRGLEAAALTGSADLAGLGWLVLSAALLPFDLSSQFRHIGTFLELARPF